MSEDRIHLDPEKRHDFMLLFDVTDGNPNGDPDAHNLPRVDPETMQGLVTDVCLKRKVRDFVDVVRGDEERYKIYVEHRGVLNLHHERAYTAYEQETGRKIKNKKSPDRETQKWTRRWMCENFFDMRMFGAVMTTSVNCGQVRGPAQMTFARSIDPVVPLELTITRVAVTRAEDAKVDEEGGKETEMGRRALLPYGLYLAYGFYSAHFASQTGVDTDDLCLFWRALSEMWDLDRSTSRGMMTCRGLYVFSHDNRLGKAPAHELFGRMSVSRNDGVEAPRSFEDYTVVLDGAQLPDGVTLTRLA